MSLRMNLYGWSLPDFMHVLGSKDPAVLEKATALITKTLPMNLPSPQSRKRGYEQYATEQVR